MKRRLSLWMILLFTPLVLLLAWFMSQRSFSLAMEREQQRALMTETMIAPQVKKTIMPLEYDGIVQAARQYRNAYAAQGVELIFCYNGIPLGGATLPNRNYSSMTGIRSAMLDTLSDREQFVISEPLTEKVTLLVLRDVSDLFAMRRQMRETALLAAVLGAILAGILSYLLASRFIKPVAGLTDAAQSLSRGEAGKRLPTTRKDELGTLARAFEEMRQAVILREEQLKTESENRQLMLDAMAHEMRTPLCALLGNARLLQMPIGEKERGEAIEDMVHEIRRLTDMDEQLMKLTRLSHEPIEAEAVELRSLLQATAKRLLPQAEGIEIRVEGGPVTIIGDRNLLSLLADNLTVNALRASSAGQTVTLTTTENGFTVKDSGIGMTEEQLSHLFEPFYKADKARTRKYGGAGLGLTLAKRIAELHGGRLDFVSAPEKGTAVTVTTWLHPVEDSVTQPDVLYPQEVKHP